MALLPLRKRIEAELLKYGIHNPQELQEAINNMKPLDISLMVSPIPEKEQNKVI